MEVLSAAAVLGLVDTLDGTERVGPLAGVPIVVAALDASPATARLARLSATVPCVMVGISAVPIVVDGFDVLITQAAEAPAPWVRRTTAAGLVDAVAASPEASVALVQLLRAAEPLEPPAALEVESFVYGLLQSGQRHRAWLADRPAAKPRRRTGPDRPAVAVERAHNCLRVTLDRPEVRNAYGTEMRDGLVDALKIARADAEITTIDLRGRGPDFCSGGDLSEFGTVPDPVTGHFVRASRSAAALLVELGPRCTAHLHGACVGAGIELSAFCGRVVAEPGTRVRLPEVAMGLIPGAGGTVSIARRIGRHRLAWLALTGEWLGSQEALEWGLVDDAAGP